jgi:hypothetical protein
MKASRGIQSIMVARTTGVKLTSTWQFNEAGVCNGVVNTCIVRDVIAVDSMKPSTPIRKQVF